MKIASKNYTRDKYYSIVRNAVEEILKKQGYVSPVDLFIHCNRLDKKKYEGWRFKRVPYLEKVIKGNLSTLNRFLRILKYHAGSMCLKESITTYKSWGKGSKIILRFSKSGNNHLEKLYSTHYVIKKTNGKGTIKNVR
ncbi:MAG: hypothetical protein A7316_10405 [Candidatus Altiarchaeales archaeon WOR_SM1_86-2]|nr:MAG: hypothetical protein A7316_10405 [Candidatus Altiarchaeales archaeon WOR_SM1_86-2]